MNKKKQTKKTRPPGTGPGMSNRALEQVVRLREMKATVFYKVLWKHGNRDGNPMSRTRLFYLSD